jgi:hypothetical protein
MSDSTAAAVIGACAILGAGVLALIAVLLPLLLSTRKHARAAAEQVTNDHATNLRVELDERNRTYVTELASVKGMIRGSDRRNGRRFAAIGRDIKTLKTRLDTVEEKTNPTRRRAP